MQTAKLDQKDALPFMLSGNAYLSLKSLLTNKHFTYRVKVCDSNPDIHFVSLLTGNDNESDYKYIGYIKANVFYPRISNKKYQLSDGAKAFSFVFENLVARRLMTYLEIWHEGRCGRCGRKLTTPESVERGIGPECYSIINKNNLQL